MTHFGMTQAEARAKAGSTGDFQGPRPLCGNGSYHVTVARSAVTCPRCLEMLANKPAYLGKH